ncbi:helix-turn-helix domain-containing protein [Rhodobacter capsulatus]|uniref:helix-turn-helix domain-containing protein n=1 Tax=Rhodobacter capsulatus TaxID=1061 RepID=UPI0003D2CBDA|nr:helix-turn-helix domain-containing protein [Rhodobacter capsulatus]ETD87658.1 hypothetical protein U713_16650 [Rhodobacter capsulatus YW2]
MSKPNSAPYSWSEIEAQVRSAILCQASILACLGPAASDAVAHYLGVDVDRASDLSDGFNEGLDKKPDTGVVIERHHLYDLARNAYDFAYQLDGYQRASHEDQYEISCAVLTSFAQTDMHGNPSPLSAACDEPLRRVFETFVARWKFMDTDFGAGGLTVRELALLSNMTVPAVRTSLSKEGFKLDLSGRRDDDKGGVLDRESALTWLSRRRGFIPNRWSGDDQPGMTVAEVFALPDLRFDVALANACSLQSLSAPELAAAAQVSATWLETVLSGKSASVDVPALRAIARVFSQPEPEFVGRAVQHLLSLDVPKAPS